MNTFRIVKSLVLLQYAGAMVMSFMHIVSIGQRYGLTWEAYVAPLLIDGFMILGAIGRSERFAEATRKTGLKLMAGAGIVSLICNVMAGHNIGQRVFGALVVVGALTAEWYGAKLDKAPAPTRKPTRQPWSDERRAAHEARKAAKAVHPVVAIAAAPPAPSTPQSPAGAYATRAPRRTSARRELVSPLTGNVLVVR
jgi:hypothetical protein